ncbi:MAG TPA: glycosyl hydrolase [Mycobacterium sp.]|nr:glycosyl hydrolase [Mycobacterium sp.]
MPTSVRTGMSRRAVLASLSLGALTLVTASNACRSNNQPRVFGLAANGIDDAAVKQAEATADSLGKRLDVLTVYDAFARQAPLPTELLDRITASGAVPLMTWEPWNPTDGATQPLYSAAQIAGGRYDAYVATWAKQAAAYNRHCLIRFAHEMNGNWYPWSVGQSDATPEDYVAAYRRVRRIFDDSGATQVRWVWSPNVIINGNTDVISRCYPGDDYVDIIGVDGYNFGDDPGHRWRSPSDLFGPTLKFVANLAHRKPLWITEVGCSDRGGDKAAWITDLLKLLESTNTEGLIWFEADKTGEPDWRLRSSTQTSAAAEQALSTW